MTDIGADPALVASQSSQSSLSRPFGFDPGEIERDISTIAHHIDATTPICSPVRAAFERIAIRLGGGGA